MWLPTVLPSHRLKQSTTQQISTADASGRVELVNVSVPGEPQVRVGQVVQPAGLVGFAWEQTRNGEVRRDVARLEETGHTLDHFDQEVRSRMPTPGEARALRLPPAARSFTWSVRPFDTDDRAVEVCDTIMAADAYVLA